MLGELLHSFFFGMPAILAITAGLSMQNKTARLILIGGGALFTVLIWAGLLGMLACDGRLLTGYSNCTGGAPIDSLLATLSPLLTTAAYAYILIGPPLMALAYLLEWRNKRKPATA